MAVVRPAAVAGAFYSADPSALGRTVDALLDSAAPNSTARGFIVPHAGLQYSGPIAATAYASIARLDPPPTRVVLLGPSHHVAFTGLALPAADTFETPLGSIALDGEAMNQLKALPFVRELPRAHAKEHCLEVQLPFLQRVLPRFTLVPLVVGDATPADVATVIDRLWSDTTLLLVSSDLSHFLTFADAKALDARTAKRIEALDSTLDGDDACGCRGINGLLELARRKHLRINALDLRNSGDTAGDRSRVVGYGTFSIEEPS
ncbi:MAG: AmmeMemoRadiSam system protein B [Archangiaceae bacterium]|nr:AmmeMemoRadiSam system protein B [Archangiaceae bacterium]